MDWRTCKWCWMARQYKKGWRIYLCIGNSNNPVDGVWFKDPENFKKILPKNKIVFVYLDDSKNLRRQ